GVGAAPGHPVAALTGLREPIVVILLIIGFMSWISGKPLDGLLILLAGASLAWDAGRRSRQAGPAATSPAEATAEGSPVAASPLAASSVAASPAEVSPAESGPAEASLVEASPVEASPAKASPAKASPAKASPAKADRAGGEDTLLTATAAAPASVTAA